MVNVCAVASIGDEAMEPNPTRGAQAEPEPSQLARKGCNGGQELAGSAYGRPMTAQRQRVGRAAEDLVASRLIAAGWEILERNARTRYGELDIVALDGRTLVFVEVKAGREGSAYGPERPVLAVDRRKQQRIRRLSSAWMAEHRDVPYFTGIRFDAVGITFNSADHPVDFEHIKNAF
jgi:putative endonuclease